MAKEIKHYINGTQIRPVNAKDIGIKLSFNADIDGQSEISLTNDTVILANEAKQLVIDHITTGPGVFHGIPYNVDVDGVIINMYIDLTETPKLSRDGDGAIEVKVKKRQSFADFKKNAEVLSFEAVNKTHPISTIDVPYVIIPDNQGGAFISSFIGTLVLGKALKESVMELAKSVQEFAEALSPTDIVVSVGATGPVFGTVTVKPGSVIMAALKLVFRIIYFIAMMLLFVNMLNKMLQIISPLVHNLKGSTVTELIRKGCAKLGYTFQSGILDNTYKDALTILPVPLVETNQSIWQQMFFDSFSNSYNKGYPTANDTTPTLWSLIEAMLDMFNGKIQVNNGVIILERRDTLQNVSQDVAINTLNLQSPRFNEFTYNTGDAWKRYWIHYKTDQSDIHTLDNMKGVHAEYSTEPISTPHADLVNLKGLSEVNIPFALGARKNEVTELERVFKTLAIVVNAAGSVFGSSLSTDVQKSSLGVLKISQQHFTVTKILYSTGGGKQSSAYLDFLSATKLWDDYHFINEVNLNFKEIYNASIPFSSKNLLNLQGNNYMFDQNGDQLEVLDFEWINETKTAELQYAVNSQQANNTTTIKIV